MQSPIFRCNVLLTHSSPLTSLPLKWTLLFCYTETWLSTVLQDLKCEHVLSHFSSVFRIWHEVCVTCLFHSFFLWILERKCWIDERKKCIKNQVTITLGGGWGVGLFIIVQSVFSLEVLKVLLFSLLRMMLGWRCSPVWAEGVPVCSVMCLWYNMSTLWMETTQKKS